MDLRSKDAIESSKQHDIDMSNILIAEFMGIENTNGLVFQDANTKEFHSIKYHSSWDWLMPVLKKINIQLNPDNYNDWRMINRPTEYYLEDVYAQVVHFISEYNQNN